MPTDGLGTNGILEDQEDQQCALAFPKGFVWGTATSAYQVEGAVAEGGRTPSIWDTFVKQKHAIRDGSTGETACDCYHRFRQDVKLMSDMGLQGYRFSISWSRILPEGRGKPNPEALEYYNALIDELLAHNIAPYVTLYHWDYPQCLHDEYGSWLGRDSCTDFESYAATCFRAFGDRVKHWITINEGRIVAVCAYLVGEHAPGNMSHPDTEPYIAGHHMILAHARAASRYHRDFQHTQHGQIGVAVDFPWTEPRTDSEADVAASRRHADFHAGWFLDPIFKGDYPASMRQICGARLPTFTQGEKALLRGSIDFIGLNHYWTRYASPRPVYNFPGGGYIHDIAVKYVKDPRWEETTMGWSICPWGLKRVLLYLQKTYNPRNGLMVTENGCALKEDGAQAAVHDAGRIAYFQGYMAQMHEAIKEGAKVRGYFAWSLLDNWEWSHGYTQHFGLFHVNRESQKRVRKDSATFLSKVAQTNKLQLPPGVLASSRFSPPPWREADTALPQWW